RTYVDLSVFQVVEGLRYAFPNAMERLEPELPRVTALRDRVAARPRIAAYLASKRRQAFNEMGIFRHYPDLDAPPLRPRHRPARPCRGLRRPQAFPPGRGVGAHPAPGEPLPLREVFPDVWLAASVNRMTIPLKLTITFSRNMVAVRSPGGWVLLNPVRLSERGGAELLAKAPIRHAVRLGTFHGRADRYYVDKFGVEFWGVPGEQTYADPTFSRELTEDGPFPIPGARVVIFRHARRAECVVNLPQHGLLVTCDSVQRYDGD